MKTVRFPSIITIVIATSLSGHPGPAAADHKCDPVTDAGWSVVPSDEVTGEMDSAPYQDGGTWFIERSTTVLPLCNYFDAIGNYSLRSYSLAPRVTKERVAICRGTADGQTVSIPPYLGSCPPKADR